MQICSQEWKYNYDLLSRLVWSLILIFKEVYGWNIELLFSVYYNTKAPHFPSLAFRVNHGKEFLFAFASTGIIRQISNRWPKRNSHSKTFFSYVGIGHWPKLRLKYFWAYSWMAKDKKGVYIYSISQLLPMVLRASGQTKEKGNPFLGMSWRQRKAS